MCKKPLHTNNLYIKPSHTSNMHTNNSHKKTIMVFCSRLFKPISTKQKYTINACIP